MQTALIILLYSGILALAAVAISAIASTVYVIASFRRQRRAAKQISDNVQSIRDHIAHGARGRSL